MATLDTELLQLIGFFEKATRARVKDCFYDQNGKLTFIVEPGDIGKAIGKGASTLKNLERKLGKRIRVAEFADDKLQLIKNLTAPLTIVDIEERMDGVIIVQGRDMKTNGLLIGKKARNLRNLEWMVRKYFEVPEIKVV